MALHVLVPLDTEDITSKWFEQILNIKIDSDSFSAEGNANAGVGFLSNLVRVRFDEICPDGSKKEHCVVAKLLPPQEADRQLVMAEKMDKSEIYFYQQLRPQLLQEMPSLDPFFCPVIYSEVQEENKEKNIPYASVLVLNDLKKDGYIGKPWNEGELTQEEILLTLDFIAKFHAATTLVEVKKKIKLPEVYEHFPLWYYPNESPVPFVMHSWFIKGFKPSIELVTRYIKDVCPEKDSIGKEIISGLLQPLAPYAQRVYNEVLRAGQKFPTLLHGDLWQNNILMVPENSSSVKVIDWQMVGYSDSVYDLAVFLITALLPDLTVENLEKHTKMYFDKLEAIYAAKERQGVDLSCVRRRSWPEFWQAMKTFGCAFIFIVCTAGCTVMINYPGNWDKIFEAFRFYHCDVNLAEFLIKAIN